MSFAKQAGITLFARGVLLVITFAYNIILARYLKAEGVGVVRTLLTFSSIAVQFGNLGLATGAIYFIGIDKERASIITGTIFTTGLLFSFFLFIGFAIAGWFFPSMLGGISYNLYILMLLSIAPLILSLFFQNILLVYQKITQYNIIEVSVRAAALVVAIIIFLKVNQHLWIEGIVWVTVLTGFAMGFLNGTFVYLHKQYYPILIWDELKRLFSYGWKAYYASFMAFLIIRSDIIFLNAYVSDVDAGIYRQAVYVSDLVYLIPMTLGTLLFPKLMQGGESKETGADDRTKFTMLIARIVGAILLILWIFFAIIGKWFLGIFGEEFVPGYMPLMILLGGILMLGIETILATELARRGLPVFVVVYSTICVIIKFIGNFMLVPEYGMYGAAWSSLATHFVFLVMVLWFCIRYYGFNVKDTLFLKWSDVSVVLNRMRG